MGDVWPSIANVAIHLSQNSDMLIAVQERVLVLAMHSRAAGSTVGGLVCFEAGVGEDDDKALGVLVRRRDRCTLLGNKLG